MSSLPVCVDSCRRHRQGEPQRLDRTASDPAEGRAAMLRTAEMIRSAGFDVDPEFWPIDGAADCTQSYAGCSDSPVAK